MTLQKLGVGLLKINIINQLLYDKFPPSTKANLYGETNQMNILPPVLHVATNHILTQEMYKLNTSSSKLLKL